MHPQHIAKICAEGSADPAARVSKFMANHFELGLGRFGWRLGYEQIRRPLKAQGGLKGSQNLVFRNGHEWVSVCEEGTLMQSFTSWFLADSYHIVADV